MSDSIDRVFVHALNTVKRIPRTGSARPPESDRLKLYGLYKQSTEGDVRGLLPRPSSPPSTLSSSQPNITQSSSSSSPLAAAKELAAEGEKYHAWDANHGLSKTEAKRRYIACLIATMHRYATTTPEARELVAELEFVWDQVKGVEVGGSSSGSPAAQDVKRRRRRRRRRRGGGVGGNNNNDDNDDDTYDDNDNDEDMRNFTKASTGATSAKLKLLRPMSDGGEVDLAEQDDADNDDDDIIDAAERPHRATRPGTEFYNTDAAAGAETAIPGSGSGPPIHPTADSDLRTRTWRRRIERALGKLSVEIAALREQIELHSSLSTSYSSSGGWAGRRRRLWRFLFALIRWTMRHVVVDAILVVLMVAWARRKGDRRLEEGARLWYWWAREQIRDARTAVASRSGWWMGMLLSFLSFKRGTG